MLVSELGVLGAHPSGWSLKHWGARCWAQTLCSLGRWELGSPLPIVWCCVGEGFMRVCLSLSHQNQCGYFLICFIYRSYSANLWISFGGNCSMCIQCVYGKRGVQEPPVSLPWIGTSNEPLCNVPLLVTELCHLERGVTWVVKLCLIPSPMCSNLYYFFPSGMLEILCCKPGHPQGLSHPWMII